jgi:hypothetical protein
MASSLEITGRGGAADLGLLDEANRDFRRKADLGGTVQANAIQQDLMNQLANQQARVAAMEKRLLANVDAGKQSFSQEQLQGPVRQQRPQQVANQRNERGGFVKRLKNFLGGGQAQAQPQPTALQTQTREAQIVDANSPQPVTPQQALSPQAPQLPPATGAGAPDLNSIAQATGIPVDGQPPTPQQAFPVQTNPVGETMTTADGRTFQLNRSAPPKQTKPFNIDVANQARISAENKAQKALAGKSQLTLPDGSTQSFDSSLDAFDAFDALKKKASTDPSQLIVDAETGQVVDEPAPQQAFPSSAQQALVAGAIGAIPETASEQAEAGQPVAGAEEAGIDSKSYINIIREVVDDPSLIDSEDFKNLPPNVQARIIGDVGAEQDTIRAIRDKVGADVIPVDASLAEAREQEREFDRVQTLQGSQTNALGQMMAKGLASFNESRTGLSDDTGEPLTLRDMHERERVRADNEQQAKMFRAAGQEHEIITGQSGLNEDGTQKSLVQMTKERHQFQLDTRMDALQESFGFSMTEEERADPELRGIATNQAAKVQRIEQALEGQQIAQSQYLANAQVASTVGQMTAKAALPVLDQEIDQVTRDLVRLKDERATRPWAIAHQQAVGAFAGNADMQRALRDNHLEGVNPSNFNMDDWENFLKDLPPDTQREYLGSFGANVGAVETALLDAESKQPTEASKAAARLAALSGQRLGYQAAINQQPMEIWDPEVVADAIANGTQLPMDKANIERIGDRRAFELVEESVNQNQLALEGATSQPATTADGTPLKPATSEDDAFNQLAGEGGEEFEDDGTQPPSGDTRTYSGVSSEEDAGPILNPQSTINGGRDKTQSKHLPDNHARSQRFKTNVKAREEPWILDTSESVLETDDEIMAVIENLRADIPEHDPSEFQVSDSGFEKVFGEEIFGLDDELELANRAERNKQGASDSMDSTTAISETVASRMMNVIVAARESGVLADRIPNLIQRMGNVLQPHGQFDKTSRQESALQFAFVDAIDLLLDQDLTEEERRAVQGMVAPELLDKDYAASQGIEIPSLRQNGVGFVNAGSPSQSLFIEAPKNLVGAGGTLLLGKQVVSKLLSTASKPKTVKTLVRKVSEQFKRDETAKDIKAARELLRQSKGIKPKPQSASSQAAKVKEADDLSAANSLLKQGKQQNAQDAFIRSRTPTPKPTSKGAPAPNPQPRSPQTGTGSAQPRTPKKVFGSQEGRVTNIPKRPSALERRLAKQKNATKPSKPQGKPDRLKQKEKKAKAKQATQTKPKPKPTPKKESPALKRQQDKTPRKKKKPQGKPDRLKT